MKFSIVIPIYNSQNYLKQCVESLITQDYNDYEIILVDDGSKDKSGAICDSYAKENNQLHVIHKANGGQSTARNVGVNAAEGEYIVFLDSDDFIIEQHFLSTLAEKAQKKPDIIIYKYKKYFEKINTYDVCNYSYSDISNECPYEDILLSLIRKDAFFCSAWSKAVKREVLSTNHIRFDEASRCEDMDWYFSVVSVCNSIELVDQAMIGYRQHENSVTSVKNIRSIDQFLQFFEKWTPRIEKIKEQRLKNVLNHAVAKLYVNLLISYCSLHDSEKQTRYKEIGKYKFLLKYHDNPRVKKVWHFEHILGLRMTLNTLNLLVSMKR